MSSSFTAVCMQLLYSLIIQYIYLSVLLHTPCRQTHDQCYLYSILCKSDCVFCLQPLRCTAPGVWGDPKVSHRAKPTLHAGAIVNREGSTSMSETERSLNLFAPVIMVTESLVCRESGCCWLYSRGWWGKVFLGNNLQFFYGVIYVGPVRPVCWCLLTVCWEWLWCLE